LYTARAYVLVILHQPSEISKATWSNEEMQTVFKENEDLLADIIPMMRLQAGKFKVDPREDDPCDYHQHTKTEVCPYDQKR
jgi:hypothetical protein